MSPIKLISFEETYSLSDETARSTVKFKVGHLQTTIFSTQPQGLSGLSIEAGDIAIEHHYPTRSSYFKFKKQVGENTKLALSQNVPNNKWYLVPNPAIKLTHSDRIAGAPGTIQLDWDTLTRQGGASLTMYGGDDKEYKTEIEAHSVKGLKLGARAKINKGTLIHSVSASVGLRTGPTLKVKSKLGEGFISETSYRVYDRVLEFEAKKFSGNETNSDKGKVTTSLEASIPLARATTLSHPPPAPKVIIGMKYTF